MIDYLILDELQKSVAVAVTSSSVPDLPVAYIDRTFTPPDGQRYLECVFIPNNPADPCWNNETLAMGMFRLVLHWPNRDEGAIVPATHLASICSYFNKDLPLQNCKISDNPKAGGVLETGTETLYPASMRYHAFKP